MESVVTGDAVPRRGHHPPAVGRRVSASGRSSPWPRPHRARPRRPGRTSSERSSVELVHLASLYHDDVMDEATVRQERRASVNARFGNLVAIVAGDFLLARSAEIAAGLGTEIAGLLAATLGELCQGQVAEVHAAFQVGTLPGGATSQAISGKTASLMATSCRIGALTEWPARGAEVEAVTSFGRSFGMVFQVRDDILDIIGIRGRVGQAGRPGPGGRRSTPSRSCWPWTTPRWAPSWRPLLGQPLGQPERDKARSIVAGSSSHRPSRWWWPGAYAEEAAAAAAVRSVLRAGHRFRRPGPLAGRRPTHRVAHAGRPRGRRHPGSGRAESEAGRPSVRPRWSW